jgi:hypothetical protein
VAKSVAGSCSVSLSSRSSSRWAGCSSCISRSGRQPAISGNSTLILRLDDDLHEVPTDSIAQLLEGNRASGLHAVLDNLRKAKADARVKTVVVMPSATRRPREARRRRESRPRGPDQLCARSWTTWGFDAETLLHRMRVDAETAVREGRLDFEQSGRLLRFYEDGLHGYTYLEDAAKERG